MLSVTMWVLQTESCLLQKQQVFYPLIPPALTVQTHFQYRFDSVVPSPLAGIIHIIQIMMDITDSIII